MTAIVSVSLLADQTSMTLGVPPCSCSRVFRMALCLSILRTTG
ncbi:hypothetical protein SynMITS9220_02387 [Synechococcus sp. MIT S9220]|nr:hypothetical protein SynMITS9220_02387 [Synechococcus sp. MIT S9220]